MSFCEHVALGRSGLSVSRIGIGASYGVPARAIERAYREFRVNYLYWGSIRRSGMREAIRNLGSVERDALVIVFQSYDRTGPLMSAFHERGLRSLGIDCADVLILGWYNSPPSRRVLEAAVRLKEHGKVRCLAVSGHHRPMFGKLAQSNDLPVDIFMFRYNAAHRGAERDIFPFLPAEGRPGITCYTATRWGQLMEPGRMPKGERPLTAAECYRFVLSNPDVDLCLSGPRTAEELDEALTVLAAGPLTVPELERIRSIGDYVHG